MTIMTTPRSRSMASLRAGRADDTRDSYATAAADSSGVASPAMTGLATPTQRDCRGPPAPLDARSERRLPEPRVLRGVSGPGARGADRMARASRARAGALLPRRPRAAAREGAGGDRRVRRRRPRRPGVRAERHDGR